MKIISFNYRYIDKTNSRELPITKQAISQAVSDVIIQIQNKHYYDSDYRIFYELKCFVKKLEHLESLDKNLCQLDPLQENTEEDNELLEQLIPGESLESSRTILQDCIYDNPDLPEGAKLLLQVEFHM